MSCHNIGHSLNTVAEVVFDEYDNGRIPYESAFRLLLACREGVWWCDGNDYEAVECSEGRCGTCLRKGLELRPSDWQKTDHSLTINYRFCPECIAKYNPPLEE